MKLEVGKSYRTKDGRVVKILAASMGNGFGDDASNYDMNTGRCIMCPKGIDLFEEFECRFEDEENFLKAIEIADRLVPGFRCGSGNSLNGHVAKRWFAARDAACLAMEGMI